MIKISKSLSELNNKTLLLLANHQNQVKLDIEKTFDELKSITSRRLSTKSNNSVQNITYHEVFELKSFNSIYKYDNLNLGYNHDFDVFKEGNSLKKCDEINNEVDYVFKEPACNLTDFEQAEKSTNLNELCSRCNKYFVNQELFIQIDDLFDSRLLNFHLNCFKCCFCFDKITENFVMEKNNHENIHNESGSVSNLKEAFSESSINLKSFDYNFYHSICFYNKYTNKLRNQIEELACKRCKLEINDNMYLIIDKNAYHTACLKCHKCNCDFENNQVTAKVYSKFYCENCIVKECHN